MALNLFLFCPLYVLNLFFTFCAFLFIFYFYFYTHTHFFFFFYTYTFFGFCLFVCFYTTHCALGLARDYVPQKCPLLLL